MENKLNLNQNVYFIGERLPYVVKAISERYAVVTRLFDKKEDKDLITHEVKMGGFMTRHEAEKDYEGQVVYSLLDFEESRKAPNNMVFNDYDYKDQVDIDRCLADLVAGKIELSRRNGCDLHIDWGKSIG
jgi:hypothetical protein